MENGVEKITSKILSQALEEADKITAAAEEKARVVTEKTQAKANEETALRLKQAEQRESENLKRNLLVANLDLRKEKLRAKQNLIDEAFDCALKAILSMEKERYISLLLSFFSDYRAVGGERILLNQKDRETLGEEFLSRANALPQIHGALALQEGCGGFAGGFVIVADGVEINNTIEARLRLLRQEMAGEIAEILFDGRDGSSCHN